MAWTPSLPSQARGPGAAGSNAALLTSLYLTVGATVRPGTAALSLGRVARLFLRDDMFLFLFSFNKRKDVVCLFFTSPLHHAPSPSPAPSPEDFLTLGSVSSEASRVVLYSTQGLVTRMVCPAILPGYLILSPGQITVVNTE